MFCPKCGKINPDDAQLCSGCNAVLKEETEEKVKKKSPWKVILAGVLVVLAIVLLIFFLSGCTGGNINPNEKVLF